MCLLDGRQGFQLSRDDIYVSLGVKSQTSFQ
jgi:hypothetical protein